MYIYIYTYNMMYLKVGKILIIRRVKVSDKVIKRVDLVLHINSCIGIFSEMIIISFRDH